MRRNGYLWTSGENLDTGVRFADADFLLECKILAIRRRFPLIFAFYIFLHFNFFTKFEVDISIHCRDIAFLSADTSRDLVTLTFALLTLNSGHSWRVTCPSLLPSMKTLCLSVVELRVITFPTGCHWKTITFLESPTLICIFTVQLQWLYDEYN